MARKRGRARKIFIASLPLVLAALVGLAVLPGCGGKGEATGPGKTTVTDMAGRSVEVKVPAERVVAIGPGALRLVCYVGAADKVVGIENMEKQWSSGRPYIMAHPELLELPVIGQGGPDSSPDPEKLMGVDPDVIFVAYLVDAAKADELQQRTGIPVVVLSYGQLGTFDRELMDSITLVGEITGNQERATRVLDFIRGCQEDLAARTKGIPKEDKPRVYVGGIGFKGTHGIESTQGGFPPLDAIGAVNVADETGKKGSVMVEKEKILAWDPDIIFIDGGGLSMVKEDYGKNPGFYRSLRAVREGRVYVYLPYNYYTTNVDTALADAYFMGKVVFPEAFGDVDPAAKADEIYRFLLGKDLYEQMARDFMGFVPLDLAH
ncbi:MAG: iron ABC transporter substrate-binding protein [Candidatus Geothermincolales bacterium]